MVNWGMQLGFTASMLNHTWAGANKSGTEVREHHMIRTKGYYNLTQQSLHLIPIHKHSTGAVTFKVIAQNHKYQHYANLGKNDKTSKVIKIREVADHETNIKYFQGARVVVL